MQKEVSEEEVYEEEKMKLLINLQPSPFCKERAGRDETAGERDRSGTAGGTQGAELPLSLIFAAGQ